jgi:hypothetical protein
MGLLNKEMEIENTGALHTVENAWVGGYYVIYDVDCCVSKQAVKDVVRGVWNNVIMRRGTINMIDTKMRSTKYFTIGIKESAIGALCQ